MWRSYCRTIRHDSLTIRAPRHTRCLSSTGVGNKVPAYSYRKREIYTNKHRPKVGQTISPSEQAQIFANRTTTLLDASHQIASLLHRVSQLDPLPPIWDNQTLATELETRQELLEQTRKIIRRMGDSVREGEFIPSSKHGREIHTMLGECLRIYSQLPGSFKASRDVLLICRLCHLDVQPTNYENVIMAAARESRWNEAAELFRMRTDPNAHGYSPVHISVREPIGLYAIAKDAHAKEKDPAESVMDVVLNMSMVSPTDQDKYVLAAGAALGRTGHAHSFVSFLRNSPDRERLGQALSVSAMHACILCEQHQDAMTIYNELVQESSGEWQWGGKILEPIVADLVMRACAGMPGNSDLALKLLQQAKDEGQQVSIEAIHGVTAACNKDSRWEDALATFVSILGNQTQWIADGDDLSLDLVRDSKANYGIKTDALGKVLAQTMSACRGSGEYAIALICISLLRAHCHIEGPAFHEINDFDEMTNHQLTFILAFPNTDELLVEMMAAQCGLHAQQVAVRLFEHVKDNHPDRISIAVERCYVVAKALPTNETSASLAIAWECTSRSVHHFMDIVATDWNSTTTEPLRDHVDHVLLVLATIMRGLTTVGQPNASLFLAEQVHPLFPTNEKARGIFASIFQLGKSKESPVHILSCNDSILAETMRAYHCLGISDDAMKLFRDTTSTDIDPGLKTWNRSTNVALSTLMDIGEIENAVKLFETLDWASRDFDSYVIIARGLTQAEMWSSVIDISSIAFDTDCPTEEIALLAMKAADHIHRDELGDHDKFSQVREIANAISRILGVKEETWIREKYWTLKNLKLSNECLRSLYRWENELSFGMHELDLALSQFDYARKAGLKSNVDVLIAIVDNIGNIDTIDPNDKEAVQRWTNILTSVISESQTTSLASNRRFADICTRAWQALKKDDDCIDETTFEAEHDANINFELIKAMYSEKY